MPKLLSKNTKFEIATTGGTYVKINGVKSFSGLNGGSSSVIDTTDLDSVAKEKLAGLPDEGSFSLGYDWMPADAGQLAMEAVRLTGAATNWRVTLSTGDVYVCSVLVLSTDKQAQVDQIWTATAKLEVTGSVTHTAPTGS